LSSTNIKNCSRKEEKENKNWKNVFCIVIKEEEKYL
jgi:hypothetical protein